MRSCSSSSSAASAPSPAAASPPSLYIACSEWWLRFLDNEAYIGAFKVPLLRNGFRMVVFSIIIMIVVLFFRKGIMGERELPDLFRKRPKKAKKNVVEEGKADE